VSTPRVGIFGYGLAGRTFHCQLLKGAGFDVAGICTTNPERVRYARQDFPDASVVSESSALLDLDLDLVVVASANIAHKEQAIAALRQKIPTVVDKPLAINLRDTEEIIGVSESEGTPLTVFFNRRWDSDSLTAKRVLSQGKLGKIFRMDARFERFRPLGNATSWREANSPEMGGGKLLDLAPHLLSIAYELFGPAELIAASVRSIRGLSDDDSFLVLRHDSGVDSYLSACEVMGATGPRIRLSGDQGSLVISELDNQEGLLRSGKIPVNGHWQEDTRTSAWIIRGEEREQIDAEPGQYGEFYLQVRRAIEQGAQMPVSLTDVRWVAEIIDQAREVSFR
jgi:scyllo-inositol 2-dehydrogenase (NADP+)